MVLPIDDPDVLRIAVDECGEPLVDLRGVCRALLTSQLSPPLRLGATRALGRVGVRARLERAARGLAPGLRLVLVSAWRSRDLQRRLFEAEVRRTLQRTPALDPESAHRLARRYVADPDRFAPHVTGGAVDVLLASSDHVLLDMGGTLGHDGSAAMDAAGLTDRQREHRAILARAMTEAGFVNYPLEWWHWSYGDKYWARVSAATAVYGDVSEEPRTWRRRLARLLSGATRRVP